MNDKMTRLLRDLKSDAEMTSRHALKGLRWLLLRRPENLEESKSERNPLREALHLNRSVAVAYYLTEDLSQSGNRQPGRQPLGFRPTCSGGLGPPELGCC